MSPKDIPFNEFMEHAEQLIRDGKLDAAMKVLNERYSEGVDGVACAKRVFDELVEVVAISKTTESELLAEGLLGDDGDPDGEVFEVTPDVLEELQEAGVVAREGEDDDPDEEPNPYEQDPPGVYGERLEPMDLEE